MDAYSALRHQIANFSNESLYTLMLILVMLVIIFFLYKTYRASLNVEARMMEFSSLTSSNLGRRLNLIEVNSNEHHLNKDALGPLARIIESYCVLTTNAEGYITYANEPFLALYDAPLKDLIGTKHAFHVIDSTSSDAPLKKSLPLETGRAWHGEIYASPPQGGGIWLDVFVFPLSLITDLDDGHMFFGTDISRIKNLNDALIHKVKKSEETLNKVENILLHSEKMASLGTISAGIAHEINNPIAFVANNLCALRQYMELAAKTLTLQKNNLGAQGFHQILQDNGLSQKEIAALEDMLLDQSDLAEETVDGIQRVQRIIRDLKSFSHDNQSAFQEVDVHKCLDLSLNLALHEFKNRVCITRNFEENAPLIKGAEGPLSQVFVNLLVNAAQAIDDRGEICIRTHTDTDSLIIEFSDDGKGIPEEHLAGIFEPFYTTKPAGEGTGLGLAISQDIIKQHGGNISVSSQAGEGCTFTIQLPTARQATPHAAA